MKLFKDCGFLILWYKRQFLACLLMFLDKRWLYSLFLFFCRRESDSLWICCGWDFKLLNSWVMEYEQQTLSECLEFWRFSGLRFCCFHVFLLFLQAVCSAFSSFVVKLTFFLKVEVAYIEYSLLMIDHFARICYKILLKVLK